MTRPDTFRSSTASCASATTPTETAFRSRSPATRFLAPRSRRVPPRLGRGGKVVAPEEEYADILKTSGQNGIAGVGSPVA